jgi:hypothetical protein
MNVMIPSVTPARRGLKTCLRTSVLIDGTDSSGKQGIAIGSCWYPLDRVGIEDEDIATSEDIESWRLCHVTCLILRLRFAPEHIKAAALI